MEFKIEIAVASRGVRVEAGINGASLVRVHSPRSQQTIVPVDWWTLPEDNLLTATVSAEDGDEPASLDFSVRPTDDRTRPLARVAWQLPPGTSFEPFGIALPFAAPGVSPSTLWGRCAPVEDLDADTLAAIQAAGAALHQAFGMRDAGRIARQLDGRIADFCAAFGDDPEEHRRAVQDDFAEMLSTPGVALAPVGPSEIRVTPCAGDRVFHLTRPDGGELIDLRGESLALSMQVFVARVDGAWCVVR